METIQYAIYQSYGGTLIADYSYRVQGLTFASNNRGYAECACFVPMGLDEAFLLYDRPGLPHVQITDSATGTQFQGRLEDVAITGDGVTLHALGYSRAMSDSPYTALWSDASVASWQIVTSDLLAGASENKGAFDAQNRLFIGLQKNTLYVNNLDALAWYYQRPSLSSRSLIGISFDFTALLPAGFQVGINTYNDAFGGAVGVLNVAATGVLQTGTVHQTFAAAGIIALYAYNGSGANITFAGENGTNYLKITKVRVVSSTANRVNTTLGTNIAAGTRTVTPASMVGVFVGQSLQIDQGSATVAESVTVTAITSTTFTAVFAFAHVIASTVNAHVIYADEIAKDLVSVMSTLNSAQLSSSTALISSPAVDLQNEVYQDQLPSDVLDYLVGIGDASGRQWEWGVRDSQRLYLRQQGSAARTWYVDASDLDVQRTLDLLFNSVYAVYSDSASRTLRTAATSDAASIARNGVTRRQALSVSTTSATQAGLQQAAALSDTKDPKPRALVSVTQVFDAGGSRWPLWSVAAGDTMIIRNLSPTLSTTIDRIRSFRVSRADYDAASDTLHIEPETPRPSLEALLAHIAAGVRV